MHSENTLSSSGNILFARRLVGPILLACGVALLGGCGVLSGAGPRIGSITDNANSGDNGAQSEYGYDLIDLSPGNIASYMRPPEPALRDQVAATDTPEIHLMAGDVLKVMISDDSGADKTVFAPLATGGTTFDQVRVAADGNISLPYVGARQVRGATLRQTEDIIRNSIKGWAASPQVHVEMVGNLSGSVLVAGAVKTPGRFSSLQGPLTILDAINQAGGPTMEPFLIKVTLRTGKTVQVYNYQDLLSGRNKAVPPNSEIILDRDRRRFVAMGAVTQPGLHDFPSATPSLLEVLGSVGGLNERMANPSGVFVFRLTDPAVGEKPKAEVFRLDMREPVSMFLAKNFQVLPDDTVYVTNAAVYEMEKIIAPIVQVLVLGRTVDNF